MHVLLLYHSSIGKRQRQYGQHFNLFQKCGTNANHNTIDISIRIVVAISTQVCEVATSLPQHFGPNSLVWWVWTNFLWVLFAAFANWYKYCFCWLSVVILFVWNSDTRPIALSAESFTTLKYCIIFLALWYSRSSCHNQAGLRRKETQRFKGLKNGHESTPTRSFYWVLSQALEAEAHWKKKIFSFVSKDCPVA